MTRLLAFLLATLWLASPGDTLAKNAAPELDIPDAICKAKIVFLGEASHGGGEAILKKAELARRLIDNCEFNKVAFESQMYDFQAFKQGTISVDDLRNAVGGIWSTYEETDKFFEFLAKRANAMQISLVGIDGQLGSSTSRYAQQSLGQEITKNLPLQRATYCSILIARLTNWSFDATNPYDDRYTDNLHSCLSDVSATTDGDKNNTRLVDNFIRFLSFSKENYRNDRDRLMADNLKIENAPPKVKTIVWTANIHASRASVDGFTPVAAYFTQMPRTVSLAITAAEGTYCPPPSCNAPEKLLSRSSPDSLEAVLLKGGNGNEILSRPLLSNLGAIPSKLFGYERETKRSWSQHFDYVIVLPTERPARHVRPAKPL